MRGCDATCILENLKPKDIPVFFYLLISSNSKLKSNVILNLFTHEIYLHIKTPVAESDVLGMSYDVASNQRNANKEEILTNSLLRKSIGKSEEDLTKFVDWMYKPNSLKTICRRFFRTTYRGAKYVVFLKSIKPVVPTHIHNFLSMQDVLQFFLPASEQIQIKEKTKNAEKCVFKCSPDK